MREKIEAMAKEAREALEQVTNSPQLNEIRVKYLGKKGVITEVLRTMGTLAADMRPVVGQMVNDARIEIEGIIERKERELASQEREAAMAAETIDVTAPGKAQPLGSLHPLTKVQNELKEIFIGMGFEIREGPEVEYDKYNFEMLNMPPNHPARDVQDTFYVDESVVLRTHTSPVQVRTMLTEKPPIRIISPGRVYRSDDIDATHSPIFHQIEGLVIDKGITMADLKGTLDVFAKELYGPQTKTRFRPSHFPFTEPSAEVDVTCAACHGAGCRICKGTGMIEILGSGMVHPNVLRFCGIDPEVYSGFAFGLGLDRITNLKYGITDIRLLFENDVRFLSQF